MEPSPELLAALDQLHQIIAKRNDFSVDDPKWLTTGKKIAEERERFKKELPADLRDELRRFGPSLRGEISDLKERLDICKKMLCKVRGLCEHDDGNPGDPDNCGYCGADLE